MSVSFYVLSPFGTAQNTITRFVQGAQPGDLIAGIDAAIAEIKALNASITNVPDKYGLATLDIGGGGDGHTFVVQIGFTTNAANEFYAPIGTPSGLLATAQAGAYLASDEEALARAQEAEYDRLRALDPDVGKQFTVFANSFAGAAKGTRFMGVVVGFPGTP